MNVFKKTLFSLIIPMGLFAQTISLDKDLIEIQLKNNSVNLLDFPFVIQDAKISSETPEDFEVSAKNTTLIILPTASALEEEADLVVWSTKGNAFLLKLNATGKEQKFTLSSNRFEKNTPLSAKRFETGKIERDIKKIMKKLTLGEKIPGYKLVDVKKQFETPDLSMQKEMYFDGGKYRAELWYLKNKTNDNLVLDYANFYTNGILAISFEKKNLNPGDISKMWLIVNKSTIIDRIKKEKK
jgi:hypothetical protein